MIHPTKKVVSRQIIKILLLWALFLLLLCMGRGGPEAEEIQLASPPNGFQAVFLQSAPPASVPSTNQENHAAELSGSIVNPYVPYTYDEMESDAALLQQKYPSLISVDSIGKSAHGRDLLLIRLGTGSRKITLNGSHHAREYISSAFLMNMVEQYAQSYTIKQPIMGFDTHTLLDAVTLYFVPMVNPDGVTLVQQGADKMADRKFLLKANKGKKDFSSWKANGRGVDLNYQYPFGWDKIKKQPGPASEGYKGTAPGTEPEAKAMMAFTRDNDFLIHTAFHSQGEIIYWYDGQTGDLYKQSLAIGKKLAQLTSYRLLSEGEQKNSSNGGYKDWTVTTFKRPGYTIELCPYTGNSPYPSKRFNDAWDKVGAAGLLLAQEAVNMEITR